MLCVSRSDLQNSVVLVYSANLQGVVVLLVVLSKVQITCACQCDLQSLRLSYSNGSAEHADCYFLD